MEMEDGDKKDQLNEDLQVANANEQIFGAIGPIGKWQIQRSILIVSFIWLPGAFHLLSMVFYR
jgi:hypothetical protein